MIERYYLKEMKQIWEEDTYYEKWKDVEIAVLKARGKNKLAEKVRSITVTPEEVRNYEKKSGHELNAFLEILEEKIGKGAGEIHKGLTSSDVMDTARMLQIKDSVKLIGKILDTNIDILKKIAVKHKSLIMAGRTHGQFAEPTTLGLKFARFLESGKRSRQRLKEAAKRLFVGQINGAVGTYSLVTPDEEEKILKNLGLKPVSVSSQVIPRDIFSDYLYALAMISSFAEEIALEIRLMSQDGIKEATEPFTSKQMGSSAMPHKKNPVICERICGLARLVQSHVGVGLQNIALWNERDISHSSNERIILEEASSLTYYILERLEFVIGNLNVLSKNIKGNLKIIGPRVFSSGVLKKLLDKGLTRHEAYSTTQKIFFTGASRADIKKMLKKETKLSTKEMDEVLSYDHYLKNIDKIYKRLEL
jgi:adenylosuccinate lyase